MKTLKRPTTAAILMLALGLSFAAPPQSQEADKLPNYVPVLPQIKARALAVDPQMGCLVTLLDGVVEQCAAEIQRRWIDQLAGVDVFGASHCRAALIYARWDD